MPRNFALANVSQSYRQARTAVTTEAAWDDGNMYLRAPCVEKCNPVCDCSQVAHNLQADSVTIALQQVLEGEEHGEEVEQHLHPIGALQGVLDPLVRQRACS